MSAPLNAAESTPVVDPIPSDKEAKDIEAITKQLEAVKAKNDKIAQRKKEHEEVKHLKEAEEEKNRQEAGAKRIADKAEAKHIANEAEAERAHDAEEARKRKVSATQSSKTPNG